VPGHCLPNTCLIKRVGEKKNSRKGSGQGENKTQKTPLVKHGGKMDLVVTHWRGDFKANVLLTGTEGELKKLIYSAQNREERNSVCRVL